MLNAFCGRFADQGAIVTTDIINDGFVKTVAADTDRRGVNHAVKGDDRHFSGTAADVHNH